MKGGDRPPPSSQGGQGAWGLLSEKAPRAVRSPTIHGAQPRPSPAAPHCPLTHELSWATPLPRPAGGQVAGMRGRASEKLTEAPCTGQALLVTSAGERGFSELEHTPLTGRLGAPEGHLSKLGRPGTQHRRPPVTRAGRPAQLSTSSTLLRGNWILILEGLLPPQAQQGQPASLAWGLHCTWALPRAQPLVYRPLCPCTPRWGGLPPP